ncbi:MAG: chromosomal replication initiator protein DnaA [Deltaproteobacteria bacterium]|nr:chromosomal replication initiator protein DnaA [Deltaproteobacteria bacterium]
MEACFRVHMDNVWQEALNQLQKIIPSPGYTFWIAPVKLGNISEETIELVIPNTYYEEWINSYYIVQIKEVMGRLLGKPISKLAFRIAAEPQPANEPETIAGSQPPIEKKSHMPASAAESLNEGSSYSQGEGPHIFIPKSAQIGEPLNPKYTFSNFVVGTSNQFAHAASYAVAENPASHYNPLFIFGGVGLGKTHILNAIGHHILQKSRGTKKICYIPSERFTNDLINSLRYEKMEQFRAKYRDSADVLLMDDIQFIAGKDRSQEEFFHTFNTLHGTHRQIVVTSDRFPKDILKLEDRLRSRFEWGLVADIQAPEIETRIAILRTKAEQDDIYLPDDVAEYLASRITTNIRELEGSLIRIGAFASLTGMEITVNLAKEVLKNILHDTGIREITLDHIQKCVASYFDIKLIDLKSKKKLKLLTTPRQIAMYLCRKYTQKSFPEIGHSFGGKDHSTVIHAVRKIEELKAQDQQLRKDIEALIRSIEN